MKEIIEIALQFIESEETREHLRSEWGIVRLCFVVKIIAYSRASLENKFAALRLIYEKHEKIDAELNGVFGIDEKDKEDIIELNKLIEVAEFAINEGLNFHPLLAYDREALRNIIEVGYE
jgi:hypothetical protein